MDIVVGIIIFIGSVIFIITLTLLGCWCYILYFNIRSHKSFFRQNTQAPVVVTSTTHTTAGGYPISVEATPSGGYQATPYPTTMPMPMVASTAVNPPYPTTPGMPMPVVSPTPYPPPSAGFQPNIAPYPPAGPPNIHPSQVNPPSYEQVVASDSYGKQSPYNPNYVNPPA